MPKCRRRLASGVSTNGRRCAHNQFHNRARIALSSRIKVVYRLAGPMRLALYARPACVDLNVRLQIVPRPQLPCSALPSSTPKAAKELSHDSGPLEFGRVMQGTVERVLLDDPFVSRDQLRIQEVDGKLPVENLSRQTVVQILGQAETIDVGATTTVALPVAFSMGQTRVEVGHATAGRSARRLGRRFCAPAQFEGHSPGPINLTDSREPLDAERLAHWFETVISVQRAAAGSAEFYQETVRAVVELVGLDGALVLLRHGERWETVAGHSAQGRISADAQPHDPRPDARTAPDVLPHARSRRLRQPDGDRGRGRQPDLRTGRAKSSAPFTASAIQSSARRGRRSSRSKRSSCNCWPRRPAPGLARQQQEAEAARSRVQFEQFFSSALAQQLQADPDDARRPRLRGHGALQRHPRFFVPLRTARRRPKPANWWAT